MKYKELKKAIFREPFLPVVIRFEDGKSVVVRHPENIILQSWYIIIGQERTWTESTPEKVTAVDVIRSRNGASRKQ